MAAVEAKAIRIDLQSLLGNYSRLPRETATVALLISHSKDFVKLRDFILNTRMTPPARDLLAAAAKAGGAEGVRFIIELVQSGQYPIEVWNIPLLAETLGRYADASLLAWLQTIVQNGEFWERVWRNDKGRERLPIGNRDNLHLFRRIVGVCLSMICRVSEWELLKKLAFHEYSTIGVVAAKRICSFATTEHLDSLMSDLRSHDHRDLVPIRIIDEVVYGGSSEQRLDDHV